MSDRAITIGLQLIGLSAFLICFAVASVWFLA